MMLPWVCPAVGKGSFKRSLSDHSSFAKETTKVNEFISPVIRAMVENDSLASYCVEQFDAKTQQADV